MKLRHIFNVFLFLAAIALTASSYAARGIVTKKPDGGNGRIIMTDLDSHSPSAEPGDIVLFFDNPAGTYQSKVGDYVTFDIGTSSSGTPEGLNLLKISTGQIISGTYNQDLTIGRDQALIVTRTGNVGGKISCNGGILVIIGGRLRGSVEVDNGSVIVTEGARVRGISFDPLSTIPADAILSIQNSTVNGNLKLKRGRDLKHFGKISYSDIYGKVATSGIDTVKLIGNSHFDDVSSRADKYVTIHNCNIRGKLEVLQATERPIIFETSVTGTVTISP